MINHTPTAAHHPISLIDVLRARKRIAPYIRRTPLIESAWLSAAAGCRISLKLESLQVSSSFKARGAFNAVLARREERDALSTRLVTASAGNHGRALALAAERSGWPLVVFTPRDAPRTKLDAIGRHGAVLRAEGRDYDDAEQMAKAFAESTGAAFISPYSDLDVIAGAGTIAPEIFDEASDVDTLVVPIGGGGLISGVAAATRRINPGCRIIGVEVAASCPFQTSLRAGRLVPIVPGPTLADGLAGNPDPETITFAFVQQYVDEIVTVSEPELATSIVELAAHEHLIAEGAGAVGIAALLAGHVTSAKGHVATIVTGSNIDSQQLIHVLASTSRG